MKILGMDLGSRRVKICYMEDGKLKKQNKYSTIEFYRDYCKNLDGVLHVDFDKIGFQKGDINVATGYGRNNMSFHGFKVINELKAHAYGAIFSSNLKDFVLLDLGGQDVKIMKIERGIIVDLELNEKCAASCGRYLENMANVLEISLDELSEHFENPVKLNSTCAIFSETELIGEISRGRTLGELCSGINYSLFLRLKPMLNKFKDKTLLVSGGVAKNKAIISFLEKEYEKVIPLEASDYIGAIGSCFYGKLKA